MTVPFTNIGVHGCHLVDVVPSSSDERGSYLRPFEAVQLADWSLRKGEVDDFVVRSHADVFRGMHIQERSAPQWKYVRATRGMIRGAVLDTSKVRHGELYAEVMLSAERVGTGPSRFQGLLIPPWCAWGYWSGHDRCEVTYRIWGRREVTAERVIHHKSFASEDVFHMGHECPLMSDRDREAKPFSEVDTGW